MKYFALLFFAALSLSAAPVMITNSSPCGPVTNNLSLTGLPYSAIKVSGSVSAAVSVNSEGCDLAFAVTAPISNPGADFDLQLFNSVQWSIDVYQANYQVFGSLSSWYSLNEDTNTAIALTESPLFAENKNVFAASPTFRWPLAGNDGMLTLYFTMSIVASGDGEPLALPFTIDFGNNSVDGYTNLGPAQNPVPEPHTYALATLGLGLCWLNRRRR
jgi:hypothetical protein